MATPALIAYEGAELAPAALAMAPELYKDTKWAARKIGRAGKRWVKKRRANKKRKTTHTFGDHPGKTHTQTAQPVTTAQSTIATRTLYSGDLIDINRATNHELNLRSLDTVHLKGMKLAVQMRNNFEKPLYFNYAVVVPKFDQSSSTVSTIDFFRSHLNGRGRNFDNTLNALEFHQQPINTDKYHVLMHKRMHIGANTRNAPSFTEYESGVKSNYITFTRYLKVDRQIRFENNDPVNGRIQFVYWCDAFDGVNATTPGAVGDFSQYNVVYFKDPK